MEHSGPRRRHDAAPYEDLRREVKRLGIRRALIVTSSLRQLHGSPLVALDIGRALAGAGVVVDIFAFDLGPPLETLASEAGLRCFGLGSPIEQVHGATYDLVWGQHWPAYAFAFLELDVRTRYFALASLSSFEPLETVSVLSSEADVVAFNSRSTRLESLAAIDAGLRAPTVVTRNALPPEWFTTPATPFSRDIIPRTVAVVSNHVPAELREAAPLLTRHGIKIQFVGQEDEQHLVDIEFIDRFDLIVSIGHTVQKGLARGRPVFCYDRFGGPGYINETNLDTAEAGNFSGRDHPVSRTPEEIRSEIIGGYHRAAILCDALREESSRRYRLDQVLADTLDAIAEAAPPRPVRRAALSPERKLTRHAVNTLVEYDLFTADSAMLADDAAGLVRLEREPLASDRIAFFREVSDRTPSVFALSPSTRTLLLHGFILGAGNLDVTAIEAGHDDGVVTAATMKAASPWLKAKFPDHPFSENGRFSVTLRMNADVHRIELVATLSDGSRVPFFAVTLQRVRQARPAEPEPVIEALPADAPAVGTVPAGAMPAGPTPVRPTLGKMVPGRPSQGKPAPGKPVRAKVAPAKTAPAKGAPAKRAAGKRDRTGAPRSGRLVDKLAVAGTLASSIVARVVGSRGAHGTQDGNAVRRNTPSNPGLPPQL